ncbi:MAG: AMP-binding protein, partial [Sedimenticola sp.]
MSSPEERIPDMDEPIWQPDSSRIEQANLSRFRRQIESAHNTDLADYPALYQWSLENPEAFWRAVWDDGGVIAETRGDVTLEQGELMPGARWFPQARLNFAQNLLRNPDERDAIIFRGEDRVTARLSRRELHERVSRLAQAMSAMGIGVGDRVAGYLPNMPETVIAMLAATSLGAVWSSCSPDFGVNGVVDRFGQIKPRLLFAAEGYFYGGKQFDRLQQIAEITRAIPSLEKVVVVPYTRESFAIDSIENGVTLASFTEGFTPGEIPFRQLPFDHPLYIMFSSGTTGVPKCIVHGAGGTLLQHLKELRLHSDVKHGDRIFYFTTCGWMMWNWLVSGLAAEATLLLYDGSPFHPDG